MQSRRQPEAPRAPAARSCDLTRLRAIKTARCRVRKARNKRVLRAARAEMRAKGPSPKRS